MSSFNILKMLQIIRTNSDNSDFIALVKLLDADLAERDGAEHSFYAQFNKLDKIKYVVVAYEDGKPVGCGAIREYVPDTMEVKRMFTLPEHRGKGIASQVLVELEKWAIELSAKKCILETGKKQPEAIALYKKNGYKIIPNYGPYVGIDNSVCLEKEIR
jgi:putative acetyltransferase